MTFTSCQPRLKDTENESSRSVNAGDTRVDTPAFISDRGPTSAYPDDNPKTVVGLTKPPLRSIPPSAALHLGQAMENGAVKYGRFNWRERTVTSSVYYDAIQRHMLSWWDGENVAKDSGVNHLAHVMACCAILIDAAECGCLNDDRREDGPAARIIERMVGAQTDQN